MSHNIRRIHADVWFRHATEPLQSQITSRDIGGKGEEVTRDMVAEKFGEEAASHWQAARDAKKAFFAAVDSKEPTHD